MRIARLPVRCCVRRPARRSAAAACREMRQDRPAIPRTDRSNPAKELTLGVVTREARR